MDHEDITENMAATEVDRPGHLATTVDCVKWAADGRLAVNLGTLVMVYKPRFDGDKKYHYNAFSVPCPEPEGTLLDLQRFPGKAGDIPEFTRKGLKYLAAQDPGLEKAIVGGDSNSIKDIAWSSLGCAWDGGCLLSVTTSLHSVVVYEPPKAGAEGWEWQPVAALSQDLLDWALRVCPTHGAKKMRRFHSLAYPKTTTTPTASESKSSASATNSQQARNKDNHSAPAADAGCGLALDGLWAVARACRTRTTAWMGRRVKTLNLYDHKRFRGGDGEARSPVLASEGRENADPRTKGVLDGGSDKGPWMPSGSRGVQGEGENCARDEVTLLAVAGGWYLTLWAFTAGAIQSRSSTTSEPTTGSSLSLALVSESPAWGRSLREPGLLGEGDGHVRALAWCYDKAKHRPSFPNPHSLTAGDSSKHANSTGAESAATSPHRSNKNNTPIRAHIEDYLAVGTSTGSVLIFNVHMAADTLRADVGNATDTPRRVHGGYGGDAATVPAGCRPVSVIPLRRISLSDGRPVSFLAFVKPASNHNGEAQKSKHPHALAVAKGVNVSLYPEATRPRTEHPGNPDSTSESSAQSASTTRTALEPIVPDLPAKSAVEWLAHEHNITALSGAPSPGPVFRTLPVSVPEALSSPAEKADEIASKDTDTAADVGVQANVGSKESTDTFRTQTQSWVLYTCSMDGRCKEWEVKVEDSETGGREDAGIGLSRGDEREGVEVQARNGSGEARFRKAVAGGDKNRRSPPLIGCSASPNGVLVAWVAFSPPERSTRKALEHIKRKGSHCRVMLTPMVPPAMTRAIPAEDDTHSGGLNGGKEVPSTDFTRVAGALATDWAWHLRAAAFADAVLAESSQDEPSSTSSPILPKLCGALERTIAALVSRHSLSSRLSPLDAACRDVSVGDQRLIARYGGHLMNLLRLHHVVVATVQSVAEYRAYIRTENEVVGYDVDDNDAEGEGVQPKEEIEENEYETLEKKIYSFHEGRADDDQDVDHKHEASSMLSRKVERRRLQEDSRTQAEAQTGSISQAQAIFAAATAPAVAARTRLALVRAWQQVLQWREGRGSSASQGVEVAYLVESDVEMGLCSSTDSNVIAVGQDEGEGPVPSQVLSRQAGGALDVGTDGLVSQSLGCVSMGVQPEVMARAERFLMYACRRARSNRRRAEGETPVEVTRRQQSENGAMKEKTAQPTTTPSAFVEMDLLFFADVEDILSGDLSSQDDSRGRAVAVAPSAEKCLLCGADIVVPDSTFTSEQMTGLGFGKEGESTEAEGSQGDVGLDLPGWAVCSLGHRVRRCMDTLAPTLSVEYRRCEVCQCVLETGGGGAGGCVAKGTVERERGACVFCDAPLTASGLTI